MCYSWPQTVKQFVCNVGVRQEEDLSPLFFALYLNDFEKYGSQCYKGLQLFSNQCYKQINDDEIRMYLRWYVLLYADDTIVLAESPLELQTALNAVFSNCKKWYLTDNTEKCRI